MEKKIETLKNIASQQENRLQEVNQRAEILLAQQSQLQQSINTIRENPPMVAAAPQQAIPTNNQLVEEIKQTVEEDEDEVAMQIKNWIESD